MTLESEFLHGRNKGAEIQANLDLFHAKRRDIPKSPCEACVMRARLAAEEHGGHWTDHYPTPGTHLRAPNDVIEADTSMVKRTVLIVGTAFVFLGLCGALALILVQVVTR